MHSGKEEATHDQQRQLHGQGVTDQSRMKAASQRSEHGEHGENDKSADSNDETNETSERTKKE